MSRRRKLSLAALVAAVVLSVGAVFVANGGSGGGEPVAESTFVPVLQDGTETVLICFDRVCPDNVPERFDEAYLRSTVDALNEAHANQTFTAAQRFSCHVITHSLGRGAVRSGLSLDTIVESWTSVCVNGFPHGLIEELSDGRSAEELDTVVDELCTKVPEESQISCVHGYGHAIAAQDLAYTPTAIERCSRFPETTTLGCVGGWFMRIVESMPRELPEDVTATDLSRVCTSLPTTLAEACSYQMWMAYIGRFTGAELLAVCDTLPGRLVGHCVRGYGALVYYSEMVDYVRDHQEMPEGLPDACESLDTYRSDCLFGMLRSRGATWSSNGYRREDFQSLCGKVEITDDACRAAEESGLTA
jgi:hypothetical protein